MKEDISIKMKVVPKASIRNKGIGDYKFDGETLSILTADMNDIVEETGVMLHEFVESLLAIKRKIPLKSIDDWDRKNADDPDPGMMKDSPYRREHVFANKIEEMFKEEMRKR